MLQPMRPPPQLQARAPTPLHPCLATWVVPRPPQALLHLLHLQLPALQPQPLPIPTPCQTLGLPQPPLEHQQQVYFRFERSSLQAPLVRGSAPGRTDTAQQQYREPSCCDRASC